MAVKICSRCIYDESVPAITFDEKGVCNYCKMVDDLKEQYKTGTPEGERHFFDIVEQIKREGKGKKYDCVVGVSGGTDSSYMVIKAVEWGLRPLAVHYDNTWNTAIATENIRKVLGKLKVDLYTHVVDNKESDDIFRAFFFANVPELDAATDLALAETLYRAADKYNLKYILEGHSFITEGVAPLGNMYFDGGYIRDVHKKFGAMKMKTYPLMDFWSFMKWILVKKIKKIRPLWYINYSKHEARSMLEKDYCWHYYGGHHLENRMTAFNHSVYFPQKFGIDLRNLSLAASARAGFISREEALQEYKTPPYIEPELVDYFKKRLGLTDEIYEKVMKGQRKTYKDYKTYKRRFELLRPMFLILAKANLVPMSFYIKYTSKSGI
ncbi:MAG: LPS biosynthesis protein [Deltaproteobacteria bacterium HGW-Deltaproteobacteria-13]|nr:MAG: LPS biosynthesis protein [Deltaproteobacteria bacterium HGW-Deltaproteobacteria-13]